MSVGVGGYVHQRHDDNSDDPAYDDAYQKT